MARYDFDCARCGPFELVRPMAQAADPAACPACGGPARRRFAPPGVARTPSALRRALEREERSAHAPEVTAAVPRGGAPLPAQHGHAHAHGPAPPWALS